MNLTYKTLFGKCVKAEPLNEKHFQGLKIAAKDPRIWRYMLISDGHAEGFDSWLKGIIERKEKGEILPYSIIDIENDIVIGFTMFLNISLPYESLDFGCVWYNPKYWGSRTKKYTAEATYLFQQLAFEVMGVRRWVMRTEKENRASNYGNVRMGAKLEGVLRGDKLVRGNVWRNTAIYSILKDEWPANREKFIRHLGYEISVSEMFIESNPEL